MLRCNALPKDINVVRQIRQPSTLKSSAEAWMKFVEKWNQRWLRKVCVVLVAPSISCAWFEAILPYRGKIVSFPRQSGALAVWPCVTAGSRLRRGRQVVEDKNTYQPALVLPCLLISRVSLDYTVLQIKEVHYQLYTMHCVWPSGQSNIHMRLYWDWVPFMLCTCT